MNSSTNWAGLSSVQVNWILIKLLCNFKKHSVIEEPEGSGKYRINDNIKIEREWKTERVIYGSNGQPDFTIYNTNSYNINGKSVPIATVFPDILYKKCQKRCK